MGNNPFSPTTKGVLRKLGGDKETSVIFPETKLELEQDGNRYWMNVVGAVPFVLTVSQNYKVVWNGVAYSCTAFTFNNGGDVWCAIGNETIMSNEFDAGEPFFIMYRVIEDGRKLVSLYSIDPEATASISTETIVPIDPKYLPGLKVIDLDSYGIGETIVGLFLNGGGTQIVENVEQFWADVDTDRVLRLKMKVDIDTFIIDQCVRTKFSSVGSVSFSFTGSYGGNMTTISCCIMREAANGVHRADIAVKVA